MRRLNVLYTVDTEISAPLRPDWRETGLRDDLARDIHGRTGSGDFGIGFQMDLLDRHGLTGVFLVEALHPDAAGPAPLREIVAAVRRPHEVQLHLHTEWLGRMEASILPGRTGQHIRQFTEDEQAALLARGIANLEAAGAPRPIAYRAGNYGADRATLRALARNGIRFDTSYNIPYLDGDCDLASLGTLYQPRAVDGLAEYPVTSFFDRPGAVRHLQLCACSAGEMEWVLTEAWRRQWGSVVIVSHSFELIRRPATAEARASPNRVVVRRFGRLCRFLERHRDRFRSVGFADLDPDDLPSSQPPAPLVSAWPRTAWRMAEQLLSRVY